MNRRPSPFPKRQSRPPAQAPPRLFQATLGDAIRHHQAGQLTEAARIYRLALALKPDSLETQTNLGAALQALGKLDEAVACLQQALALQPNCAEAWFSLAATRKAQGNLDEAAACYRRALALKPDCAGADHNLGKILQDQGKLDAAVTHYQRALALNPNYAEAHGNLGNTLHAQGRLPDAAAHHQRALAIKPDLPESHYNFGNVLLDQDKLDEAAASYERALILKPEYVEARYNLGCAHYAAGNREEALLQYRKALSLDPTHAPSRFSESLALLFTGDFAEGWQKYESRWQSNDHKTPMRPYPQPLWSGEKLATGPLLIWGEQGVGDEIMFAGLLPDVARTGNHCILDCDPRLKPLFARSFPTLDLLPSPSPSSRQDQSENHNPEPTFAAHLPSGSLPCLFRPSLSSFAATTSPYLLADPRACERFRSRYADADGRRLIGLAWHTDNKKTGRSRSIDLSLFAPLFTKFGIHWISLQYGDHHALEHQAVLATAPLLIDRSVDQLADIDLFAAQIAATDLVITIDNSTAHLAGALGVPTFLLLPFAPDWRWLQPRPDSPDNSSPWYPNMRLFRQPKLGDWQSVMQAVESAL
jgi:tetratricopeptide (TPR) repeat protein